MTERSDGLRLAQIQSAADRLISVQPEEQPTAFNDFAHLILDFFDQGSDHSNATSNLFSNELPQRIQRFTASWLLWALSKSPTALNFGNVEAMAGSLLIGHYSIKFMEPQILILEPRPLKNYKR